jgi:hypothetical protein
MQYVQIFDVNGHYVNCSNKILELELNLELAVQEVIEYILLFYECTILAIFSNI